MLKLWVAFLVFAGCQVKGYELVHLLAPLPYAAEAAWLMLLLYISKAGSLNSMDSQWTAWMYEIDLHTLGYKLQSVEGRRSAKETVSLASRRRNRNCKDESSVVHIFHDWSWPSLHWSSCIPVYCIYYIYMHLHICVRNKSFVHLCLAMLSFVLFRLFWAVRASRETFAPVCVPQVGEQEGGAMLPTGFRSVMCPSAYRIHRRKNKWCPFEYPGTLMSSAGSNEPVPRQEGITMVLRHHKDHGTCKSVSTSCGLNFPAQFESFRLVACVLDDTLLWIFLILELEVWFEIQKNVLKWWWWDGRESWSMDAGEWQFIDTWRPNSCCYQWDRRRDCCRASVANTQKFLLTDSGDIPVKYRYK